MKQLLRIEDLNAVQAKKIIDGAYKALKAKKVTSKKTRPVPLGLIFAESSTRTRVSFERAARSLGFEPYLLEQSSSSLTKGEDLTDTVLNLQNLGIENFVVRSASTDELLALRKLDVGVLNAGDGVGEHPSQALLDFLCIFSKFKGSWTAVRQKKICIVGNLSHSRVVNSWISLGKLLDLNLQLVSPRAWRPATFEDFFWTDDLATGLEGADVVMALRVQNERLGGVSSPADYIKKFQIGPEHLSGRPLMHPGPINWGVELAESLRDYKNSWILDQVRCGYYLRATLLNWMIAK